MVKPRVRASAAALALGLGVVASHGPPASAQALWRGAAVGDDLARLRRRFPEAYAPARPEILSGGEVEALRMRLPSLGGAPGVALFFMREGVLANVQLRARALRTGATAANAAFAHAVAQEIARDAGPGYDCADSRVAAVTQYTCRWLMGEVTIREYYLDVAGQAPVFYVAYRRADDPAFDL